MLGGIFRWFWGGRRTSTLNPLPTNVIVATQRLASVKRRIQSNQPEHAVRSATPKLTVRFDG